MEAGGASDGGLIEDVDGAPLPDGLQRVIRERLRQIDVEGYSIDGHDLGHETELILAALCYAKAAAARFLPAGGLEVPGEWPWGPEFWKPSHNAGRNLEKAAALMAAALDQMPAGGVESPGGWSGL